MAFESIPDQNRPPAQDGVHLEPSTTQASAGSTPAGPQPQSPQSSDTAKSIAAGGQLFGQGDLGAPVVAVPMKANDGTNVVSGQGGTLPGPAAGAGPGTGRQPAAAGSTIGQTKAAPRPMTGGFLSQGRK